MLGYLAGTVVDESNETRTTGNVKASICYAAIFWSSIFNLIFFLLPLSYSLIFVQLLSYDLLIPKA